MAPLSWTNRLAYIALLVAAVSVVDGGFVAHHIYLAVSALGSNLARIVGGVQ